MARLAVKRIHEPPSPDDGYRILVDRLWPRGISKERAAVDEWAKEVAPSNELRTWFGHRPERFAEFAERYRAELRESGAVEDLRATLRQHAVVTLLFSARDTEANQAVVLLDYLRSTRSGY
jgi:DNA-3-methyladenine glycosylase